MPSSEIPPLPPGACNAHCHVFGPRDRFPYASDAAFVPAQDAPKEALYALNDALGFSRCVVVQSACHGFDNRAAEDAVAGRPHDYRAIALLPLAVADAELQRLDAAGFRGVRFHYMGHLGVSPPIDSVIAFAARLAPLGWHLQLHGDPRLLTDFAAAILRSPVPVVIDHIGRIDASRGLAQPDFEALRRLLDDERVWVKLSGIDRISRAGPPYDDGLPFARCLLQDHPDRVVWGNDWPHPNHAGPPPDDRQLASLIGAVAVTADERRRLLVDNPQRLYRFGAAS